MNRLLGNRRRASFDVNQRPLTYKVHYLGNVTTSLTRGDGCADRPAKILWDMHLKNEGRLGRKLLLTITNSGLQAENYKKTDSNSADVTFYNTNRISYYLVADKFNPKMFIWVYRHVNIRSGLTTELRCHACLCSNETDAKSLVSLLHQHVQESLREYVREKYRRQISRLTTSNSSTQIDRILNEPPKRLLTRSQASNYRPSLARSMSNIGLGRMDDIEEDDDEELIDSETQTTLSTTSTISSSSIDLITTKLTDKPNRLYAHALSDLL